MSCAEGQGPSWAAQGLQFFPPVPLCPVKPGRKSLSRLLAQGQPWKKLKGPKIDSPDQGGSGASIFSTGPSIRQQPMLLQRLHKTKNFLVFCIFIFKCLNHR
jgi:hypothetical protein